jgi:hypothetical protein
MLLSSLHVISLAQQALALPPSRSDRGQANLHILFNSRTRRVFNFNQLSIGKEEGVDRDLTRQSLLSL